MPTIGVTGHVLLSAATPPLVFRALVAGLRRYAEQGGLHGVTCLAKGSDQIFARAVLDLGGTFEVVLPAHDYGSRVVRRAERAEFDELLGLATKVSTLPFRYSSRRAYFAASQRMLDRSERLFAVWDGRPSRRSGDTAHVVSAARRLGVPVEVFWPAGSDLVRERADLA